MPLPIRVLPLRPENRVVVALVQREGDVRAFVMPRVTAHTLANAIVECVDPTARLMTDESPSYNRAGRKMASHETVAHTRGEYARGDVCTNTVEGFFAILKRGVYGTFHSVSKKHLHRYVSEFEFRYNTRWFEDGHRLTLLMQAADGRRLTYKQQVAHT